MYDIAAQLDHIHAVKSAELGAPPAWPHAAQPHGPAGSGGAEAAGPRPWGSPAGSAEAAWRKGPEGDLLPARAQSALGPLGGPGTARVRYGGSVAGGGAAAASGFAASLRAGG
jgi:hypothetical protein